MSKRLAHHQPRRVEAATNLRFRELFGRSFTVDLSAPECFIRVDISNTRYSLLIEKRPLQTGTPRLYRTHGRLEIEILIERIAGDMANRRRQPGTALVQKHVTKSALIDEA